MTDIVITRDLPASREQVYRAWTDAEQLAWFLNDATPAPEEPITADPVVGGFFRVPMVIDDDTLYVTGGRYLELTPPARIVFTWGADDGWPSLEDGLICTVDLTEIQAGTRLAFRLTVPDGYQGPADAMRDGWTTTIDRLLHWSRPAGVAETPEQELHRALHAPVHLGLG